MKLNAKQIAAYAKAAGFTQTQMVVMTAIGFAESSGDTTATHRNSNGSTDYGVWQINSVHSKLLSNHNWKNPLDNAKMAHSIFKSQGYGAWSSYNSGSYRKFLQSATQGASFAAGHKLDDIIGDAANAVKDAVPGLSEISSAVAILTDPNTWKRIGEIAGGALLLILGFAMLALGETRIDNAALKIFAAAKTGGLSLGMGGNSNGGSQSNTTQKPSVSD